MTVLQGAALKKAILAKVGKPCVAGHCLAECRQVAGIPALYGSAKSAWEHCTRRHGGRPPAGAVVMGYALTSSAYEHVFWFTGDGRVVTINGSHWTMYSSLDALARAWARVGFQYVGWMEEVNGHRFYTPPPPKPKYRDVRALQGVLRATKDNAWGADSTKRLNAVRQASNWKGVKFPWGAAYTQGVVGVSKDGSWGPKSRAAHTAVVKAIQKIVGVSQDGAYGPKTDAAVTKYLSTAHKV